jgi:hypothetical protein
MAKAESEHHYYVNRKRDMCMERLQLEGYHSSCNNTFDSIIVINKSNIFTSSACAKIVDCAACYFKNQRYALSLILLPPCLILTIRTKYTSFREVDTSPSKAIS